MGDTRQDLVTAGDGVGRAVVEAASQLGHFHQLGQREVDLGSEMVQKIATRSQLFELHTNLDRAERREPRGDVFDVARFPRGRVVRGDAGRCGVIGTEQVILEADGAGVETAR